MLVYFIRHGKTAINLAGRISGARLDPPLSPEGIGELEGYRKAGIYPPLSEVCYTSEFLRTRQTLTTIYPGASYQATALLNERDFGPIEYETDPAAIQKWRDDRFDENGAERQSRYGDGESTPVFAARVRRDFSLLLSGLLDRGCRQVTICGHGGFLREIGRQFRVAGFENVKPAVKNGNGLIFDVERTGKLSVRLAGYIGGTALQDVVESADAK
ncbi:histidine phosphatase family protein [Intestinimonas massiliensis (ex Afouda et al. 2020)]|uniref:histidine phosphatase family protein n=1 Tax=Intestinimonas massiliensis (ex Afouda et al. 2020) TaxID=1673721 RepID=UPI0013EF4290|nr:phosphoglycerate mutase family protein [Intestinimonas massiliensis (ex Afouda et al. 2020)]